MYPRAGLAVLALGAVGDNSIYVVGDGDVGLGTAVPQVPLHATFQPSAGIGIERTIASGGPQMWEIAAFGNGDLVLFDRTNGTGPFAARPGTPNNAIFLEEDTATINAGSWDYNFNVRLDNGSTLWADGGTGDIGLGTETPTAPLHVRRSDGNARVLVENASGSPSGGREMFKRANNGGS
ncbi:hypothetical protein ACN2XU_23855 [Primorskyibacter sp. 2E107]|uniref:hypothetical protein n=1 Tax=Primorskyibacter sp. 2E107 TaxID=3403458 RepID=UPI003AF7820D